jgi:hypothetical protein
MHSVLVSNPAKEIPTVFPPVRAMSRVLNAEV